MYLRIKVSLLTHFINLLSLKNHQSDRFVRGWEIPPVFNQQFFESWCGLMFVLMKCPKMTSHPPVPTDWSDFGWWIGAEVHDASSKQNSQPEKLKIRIQHFKSLTFFCYTSVFRSTTTSPWRVSWQHCVILQWISNFSGFVSDRMSKHVSKEDRSFMKINLKKKCSTGVRSAWTMVHVWHRSRGRMKHVFDKIPEGLSQCWH